MNPGLALVLIGLAFGTFAVAALILTAPVDTDLDALDDPEEW